MGNAYDIVKKARANGRPTGTDYLSQVFTGFIELHGDRRFGDDPAIVGGLALLNGLPVTVLATEKGHNARERLAHGFGAPSPEGYRKAQRLMAQAEKFHRPVICFVDTSGAGCGVGAEERGQGQAIAESITAMLSLRVPVVSVFIGEGGSGGALALAAGDEVWMLENAIYSVISPEGCASILWKDAAKAAEAAECLRLTSADAHRFGVVERVLPETGLGSPAFYRRLQMELSQKITELCALSPEQLLERRYAKYRSMGAEQAKRSSV